MKIETSHIKLVITAVIVILFTATSYSQEQEEKLQQSADEVARELANPNATRGSMNFNYDHIWYDGDLPDASKQSADKLVFQPSLPYPIEKGVNFFLRPLIPIYFKQPVNGPNGFENIGFNLGDISADAAVGKSWQSGLIGIVGVFSSFPTATDDRLSANQTIIGPEGLIGYVGNFGFVGLLLNQGWGLAGEGKQSVSSLGGQYFITINLGDAWQFSAQPVWSYNWKAPEGSKLTLPIPVGINKTIVFGKMPIKFGLQYWYYIASPENFGPKNQIRFSVSPVIPLPW